MASAGLWAHLGPTTQILHQKVGFMVFTSVKVLVDTDKMSKPTKGLWLRPKGWYRAAVRDTEKQQPVQETKKKKT